MKLTKIHIFLILLLALVLCSTLGMCYSQEGYTTKNEDKGLYNSYSDYNKQKKEDTIRGVSQLDDKSSDYKSPFTNKENWKLHNDDDDNDRSNMNTRKPKYSNYMDYKDYRDLTDKNINAISIFDSVAKGNMNGSMYNIKETVVKEDEGVPRSRIPPGQEDMYILKSEIIPPICPACPSINCDSSSDNSSKKCQPCPPCARCPEPSFECKKVPNYNSRGLMNQLPIPWADKL